TSCGSAPALLACGLLVGHARSGSPPRAPERTSAQGRPAVRRVFVHSCGQPCGCLTISVHRERHALPSAGRACLTIRAYTPCDDLGEGRPEVTEQQINLGVVWEQVVRELSAATLSPQQRAWMRVTRPI